MIEIIKATSEIYLHSAKQANKALRLNWLILFGIVALAAFYLLTTPFFASWGMVGGFIVGFIQIILLSIYYSWIAQAVRKERINFREIFNFEPALFWGLMSVGFFLWIINMFVGPFGHREETLWVFACANFLMFVLFNAAPELVYLRRSDGFNTLKESSIFIKQYWIEWYVPLLIVLLLPISLLGKEVLRPLALGYPLLPAWALVEQFQSYLALSFGMPYLGILLGVIIATWFMIFRGFLFQELIQGSARKRAYQYRMKR